MPGKEDGIPIEAISDLFYGPYKKEDMQMALNRLDPRQPAPRRVVPPDPVPVAPLNYSKSTSYNDLYPYGSKIKTLVNVIDPFVEYQLEKNTVVAVERVEVLGKKIKIVCKDKRGVLWSVPSEYAERVADDNAEKIGRFRLLD